MNEIVVTLISVKPNELNRFLSAYYQKDRCVEEGAFRFSAGFKSLLESTLFLSALFDNDDDFQIEAYISMGQCDNIHVTKEYIDCMNMFCHIQ